MFRLGYQIATKHRVPIEILGHAMQAYNKTMYAYGDEAPCYSSPRMLEEALGVDLRYIDCLVCHQVLSKVNI